jgi:hypothetical protein
MNDEAKFKVVIAPGAFDGFEGTQEELDSLIAEITRMAEDGSLLEQSEILDVNDEADQFLIDSLREWVLDGGDFAEGMDVMSEQRKKRLN